MRNIAVIGSGVMGTGIAYVFALNQFNVHVNDVSDEALKHAETNIENELIKSAKKGFIREEDIQRSMNNLTFSMEMDTCVKDSDLVIEAVLEKMDLKIKVFQKLDEKTSPNTIFATNTSTMSPTEIGAHT